MIASISTGNKTEKSASNESQNSRISVKTQDLPVIQVWKQNDFLLTISHF